MGVTTGEIEPHDDPLSDTTDGERYPDPSDVVDDDDDINELERGGYAEACSPLMRREEDGGGGTLICNAFALRLSTAAAAGTDRAAGAALVAVE
jgi:hypothetical protein